MARSDVVTWLPLDDFAKIIGLNPLNFNQLYSQTLHQNNVCGETFFQYSWQHSDRVGREDIAQAIQQAEQEIAREVGYNLIPDWTIEERLQYPQPSRPELFGNGMNVRWQPKSVELPRGMVISGGVRAKSVIEAGAAVVRSDNDGDNYDETCTVTVATTVTDANEIRAYYPGKSAADGWEIKPITVSFSGGNVVVTFKAWQIAAANQMDALNAEPLDADDPNSYETTVDIYRVYNDPATQAQFLWENNNNCCGTCAACLLSTQAACFHLRDSRMGFAVPTPATWDSDSESFTTQYFSACREPDQVRFWYLSGYQDMNLARPRVEMSHYWKYAVAYFAASKFERPVCGCSNVNQFIEKWRRDAAFSNESEGGFTITAEQAANRLGTSMGALYAWRRIQQNGVRVHK
jgi:hypothetical protein